MLIWTRKNKMAKSLANLLIKKISQLPPDLLEQVNDFVDFIKAKKELESIEEAKDSLRQSLMELKLWKEEKLKLKSWDEFKEQLKQLSYKFLLTPTFEKQIKRFLKKYPHIIDDLDNFKKDFLTGRVKSNAIPGCGGMLSQKRKTSQRKK